MSNQKLLYRVITKQLCSSMRVNVLTMISTETSQPTNGSRREAIRKSFLRKIQRRSIFGTAKASNHESRTFHQFAKVFSLESFPLYGMNECKLVSGQIKTETAGSSLVKQIHIRVQKMHYIHVCVCMLVEYIVCYMYIT